MFPTPDSGGVREGEVLADRVEALAAWIQELDGRLCTAEVATGDAKTAKELRKAIEALAKHDPKLEERLTNRVDVLKDRLATLAETVSTTSAGLAARDGELVGLRRELEAERTRIETMVSDLRKGSGAADLESLRREIAELSSQRPRRRGDHGEGVPGNLEILEQRLDTLAKTVATTSAGLASRDGDLVALKRHLEEEDARVVSALAELRAAVDPAPVAELRLTLKELSDQTRALGRRSQQGLDGLGAGVERVSGRLESLGRSVAATADGLASREQDVAALRAAFDEETGRLDSHVTSIEQVLGAMTPQLAALGDLTDRDTVEALEEQVRSFAEAQEALAGRLDALSQHVQETGQGYAERELELAALSRRFEEAKAGVEGLVAEVRSEVQALAEAGADRELEARLDGLAQQVEGLGGRLRELDEASAGVREEASGVRVELGEALELAAGRIDALERERASSSEKLAGALEASAEERAVLAGSTRLLEERVHGFTEAVESVSRRLEVLSSAVEESGQDDSERERELALLSRRFEEGRAQVDSLVSDLREALATMPAPAPDPELEARVEALAQEVERQAATVAAASGGVAAGEHEVGSLRAQVARLAAMSEETGQGYAERELELAALSRRFEEAKAGVEGLVAEVRSEVQALAEAGADRELEARLDGLAQQVEGLGGRLRELDEASAGVREEASGVRVELGEALELAAGRIDALERERASSSEKLAGALEASAEERAVLAGSTRLLEERVHGFTEAVESVSRRLEVLSSAVEESGQDDSERERELALLSRRFEEGRAQVDSLVSDLREALATMPAPAPAPDPELEARVELLAQRLDALGAEVQSSASREETDRLLGRLLLRLDSVEHAQESLTSEVARSPGEPTLLESDVDELRALVEGLSTRLAASEQELAKLADSKDLAARLDEVTRRLVQLEQPGDVGGGGGGAANDLGDGRLRLELRGLELRVEHAEESARENREAVLTQLERLASRIEWRLQRLESEDPGSTDVPPPRSTENRAQVVPIRGSEV